MALHPTDMYPIIMPDTIHIRSGSARKHWTEVNPRILTHRFASVPDPFAQNLARPSRSNPGRYCTLRSGTSLEIRDEPDAGIQIRHNHFIIILSGLFLAARWPLWSQQAVTRTLPDWIRHVYWVFMIVCSVSVDDHIFDLFVFAVKTCVNMCVNDTYCITIK